jgi:hypothetical protein
MSTPTCFGGSRRPWRSWRSQYSSFAALVERAAPSGVFGPVESPPLEPAAAGKGAVRPHAHASPARLAGGSAVRAPQRSEALRVQHHLTPRPSSRGTGPLPSTLVGHRALCLIVGALPEIGEHLSQVPYPADLLQAILQFVDRCLAGRTRVCHRSTRAELGDMPTGAMPGLKVNAESEVLISFRGHRLTRRDHKFSIGCG